MRCLFRLIAVILLWAVSAAAAQADKRVALVIGNADYKNVAALSNPINDATAIGAALARLGFTVRSHNDVGFDSMRRALNEFAREANGADIAVVYYAGHGMEFDGQNYLIPVDARLGTDLDVPYEAISLSLALNALDGARGTRLLILDACRDNPFASSMRIGAKSRSIGRGLARIEPSVGTIVAYAAKEGTTADDGDGKHSPFAAALLEHIEEPGIDVQFLFRKVRDSVLEATNGNQEPFTYGSLPGRTVLLSPEKPAQPARVDRGDDPAAGQEIAAEVAFWNTIQNSGDRALYESYRQQYPNGRFAALAGDLHRSHRCGGRCKGTRPAAPPATSTPAAPSDRGSRRECGTVRPCLGRARTAKSRPSRPSLSRRRRQPRSTRNSSATCRKNSPGSAAVPAGLMAFGAGRAATPPKSFAKYAGVEPCLARSVGRPARCPQGGARARVPAGLRGALRCGWRRLRPQDVSRRPEARLEWNLLHAAAGGEEPGAGASDREEHIESRWHVGLPSGDAATMRRPADPRGPRQVSEPHHRGAMQRPRTPHPHLPVGSPEAA